jgi:hypothetical protein
MSKKNPAEDILAAVLLILVLAAIREFFQNDRNRIISARGRQVLDDPELMKRVNQRLKEHETKGVSGPVVVDLH